jgi:hypothetical protein
LVAQAGGTGRQAPPEHQREGAPDLGDGELFVNALIAVVRAEAIPAGDSGATGDDGRGVT